MADMLWRGRSLSLSEEQILAIWYHDAIYEIPGHENEARSAELAREQLTSAGLDVRSVESVVSMVLDTKTHVASSDEARVVIDLDLATLALDEEPFFVNTAKIREEYGSIDDETFAIGQLAMLDRFLGRERIYQSDWGRPLERQARDNLRRLRERNSAWIAQNTD
ncbi:MAG: hypothetical protein H6832_01220 [Planctomycetes bacterium]|nr:hypothetical protein [Planctomycetota bacterium]MCB9917005.1 hypothetical protein [Planctomycetota bacterium]